MQHLGRITKIQVRQTQHLYKVLSTLQHWEQQCPIEVHPKTYTAIHVTNKRTAYVISDTLHEVNRAKYLGVTIDNKLK